MHSSSALCSAQNVSTVIKLFKRISYSPTSTISSSSEIASPSTPSFSSSSSISSTAALTPASPKSSEKASLSNAYSCPFTSAAAIAPFVSRSSSLGGFKSVPGPTSYPLIGNALGYCAPDVGRNPTQSPRIWQHFHKTYGKLVRLDMPRNPPMILVFDPHLAELIYRQAGPVPVRPGFQAIAHARKKASSDYFSTKENENLECLLTAQGEPWKSLRSKVNKPLMRSNAADIYQPMIDDICLQLVQRIKQVRDQSHLVPENFVLELYRFSLESIGRIVLARSLGCFKNIQEENNELTLIRLVETLLKGSKDLDNGLRMWELFPSKKLDKFETDFTHFFNIVMKYVEEALHRIDGTGDSMNSEEMGVLENLVHAGCDFKSVSAIALDMIFAGVDTTSHTAAFILYWLATNPKCQETLYQELIATENKSTKWPAYLRAVVKESFRMTPAALGNIRQLDKSITLDQYNLPPGTRYILAHHTMSNSEEFVTNPTVFSPERWLKTNEKKNNVHPFVVLPFGHGPRMCIGRRFAEMEIYSVVSHVVKHFNVQWVGDPLQIKSETLISPNGPLKFRFIDRNVN